MVAITTYRKFTMEYFKTCTKCGGCGSYSSAYGGTCWACKGSGRTFISKAAKAAFKAAEKAEEIATAARFMETHGRWLLGVSFFAAASGHPIAKSILSYAKKGWMPSEKMMAATYKACCRYLVKLSTPPAEVVPVPTAKGETFEGEVLSVKWKESPWGGALKMLVREARGFKLWGTVPAAISEVKPGATISFVASSEPSKDDAGFGFFKRPRKAVVLSGTPALLAA